MILKVKRTSELTSKDKSEFNSVVNKAYDRIKDVLSKSNLGPKDLHFFLYGTNNLVAVGRLRYIRNIKIDGVLYENDIWGRATISVDPKRQKMGYGRKLVMKMTDYAIQNGMWVIGIHGKKSGLEKFYKKCRLEVNEDIGAKVYDHKNTPAKSLSHTNFSHFRDDPFIKAAKKASRIDIPFSW